MLNELFSGGIGARDAASAIALWYLLESDLCWFRLVAMFILLMLFIFFCFLSFCFDV